MDGLFGDGLVDVLCCGGDSLEEDLRWEPRLGGGGVALFKIVEALSGGAFFFSTSVELKTRGAGGGGAGREMMDSNTSLPAILTPKHVLAVSAHPPTFACDPYNNAPVIGTERQTETFKTTTAHASNRSTFFHSHSAVMHHWSL